MMYRQILAWCLLALFALPVSAQVQATLDRSRVALGETVTLNVQIQGDAGNVAMPDVSALSNDFDVMDSSESNSLNVINGVATSNVTVGFVLRPKHAGVLQIPALAIAGGQTAPLQLDVTSANPADSAAAGHREVFMEAQVEPNSGYVGQQLSYVARLFFSVNISQGSLDAPQLPGVQISQTGADVNYSVERDGHPYHVLERRYALTPQHPGRLEIPAMNFQGVADDPNDPDSFFGASKPVSASAPALTINVKEIPPNWGSSTWLPARQLTLTMDGVPDAQAHSGQNQVRVGQPINLTMSLQATGLPAETLPSLSLPALGGAMIYPDKPTSSNRNDGPWVIGQKQQAFAIVPQQAGVLTIPATSLKWWNVQTDRMEVAQIPAHSINVLPAIGSLDVHTASPSAASSVLPTTPSTRLTGSPPTIPWRWIAIGSVGLWLLSMLAWWLWRHRTKSSPPTLMAQGAAYPSTRDARLAFLSSAQGEDTALQMRSLLAWARVERPAIQNLGELAGLLGDAAQRAAISNLQQSHYASAPISGSGPALADAFKRGFVWRVVNDSNGSDDLPPLYPFKLH